MMKNREIEVFAQAAETMKAVAHPIRIEIINLLKDAKKLSVNELKGKLGITQSMTSRYEAPRIV